MPERERELSPRVSASVGPTLAGASSVGAPPSANDGFQQPLAYFHATYGNQAVLRMLSRAPAGIQAKLTINQPGDQYEQEADRVADQVMRMPAPVDLQRKCSSCAEEDKLQRKCDECEEEKKRTELHRKETGAGPQFVPPSVHHVLNSPGQPLDSATRAFMETRFGYDLNSIRIHSDTCAAQSAKDMRAFAYTVGVDLVFAQGQYQPDTTQGKRLLAHELTHTLQQISAAPWLSRSGLHVARQHSHGSNPATEGSYQPGDIPPVTVPYPWQDDENRGANAPRPPSVNPPVQNNITVDPALPAQSVAQPGQITCIQPDDSHDLLWNAFNCYVTLAYRNALLSWIDEQINTVRIRLRGRLTARQQTRWQNQLQVFRDWRHEMRFAQPACRAEVIRRTQSRHPGINYLAIRDYLHQLRGELTDECYDTYLRRRIHDIYRVIGAGMRYEIDQPVLRIILSRFQQLNAAREQVPLSSGTARLQALSRVRALEHRLVGTPIITTIRSVRPDLETARIGRDPALTEQQTTADLNTALESLQEERSRTITTFLPSFRVRPGSEPQVASTIAQLGGRYTLDAVLNSVFTRANRYIRNGFRGDSHFGNTHESFIDLLLQEQLGTRRRMRQRALPSGGRSAGPFRREVGILDASPLTMQIRPRHGLSAIDIEGRLGASVIVEAPTSISLADALPASFSQRNEPFDYRDSRIHFLSNPGELSEARYRLGQALTSHPFGSVGGTRDWELALLVVMTNYENVGFPQEFLNAQQIVRGQLRERTGNTLAEVSPGQTISALSRSRRDIQQAVNILRRMEDATQLQNMAIALATVPRSMASSGPAGRSVQVAHRYVQRTTGMTRWVIVNYSHLSRIPIDIRQGMQITRGASIGAVGATGNAIAAHVHLQISVHDTENQGPVFWLTPFDFFPGLQNP